MTSPSPTSSPNQSRTQHTTSTRWREAPKQDTRRIERTRGEGSGEGRLTRLRGKGRYLRGFETCSRRVSAIQAAFGLVLMLGLAGCERTSEAAESKQVEAPPTKVESVEVSSVKSPVLLRLTGALKGARETDLAANVAGKVLKTTVERGDSVEGGALIAQIDTKAAQLALAEARVSVQTSKTQEEINKTDCERYEKLRERGVVTDQEYDQVTAKCKTAPLNVDAAEARQRIAAKNVGDGMIRSPFAGVVIDRFIEVGEYVQASSRVVSIAQVDSLKLVFQVPERHFPDVKVGATAKFQVAAYGDRRFEASITRISGAVTETRDIVVEAEVDNSERKLLPGMFADIELVMGEEPLPAVPASATFEQNGKLNVMVVSAGSLEQRVVQPAPAVGSLIPVRRGLKSGDRVVKVASETLQNGQRVL